MPHWSSDPEDRIPAGRGILRKLLPSEMWHFHFKNEYGEWTSRSTQHRDKSGAITWAESFSMRLTAREFGFAEPQRPTRDDRIHEALDKWLEYKKSQNRPYTHRSYTSIVAKFKRFLETKPSLRRLRQIGAEAILEYRAWAIELGNGKVTVDNNLIALRSFFSWCKSRGLVTQNPISEKRDGERLFFGEESPRKETYTEQEYRAILAKAAPANRPVFALLANTGMRSSEAAMLEWSDVDRSGMLCIRRKRTADGIEFVPKDKTDRALPINAAAREALQSLGGDKQPRGYVIPLPAVKSRTDYFERTYLERLKDLKQATKIAEPKLTLHNFRRFFVTQCADCGIPLAMVMDWVGHDEIKMVMHYYRLRDESARQAMERFSIGSGAKPAKVQQKEGDQIESAEADEGSAEARDDSANNCSGERNEHVARPSENGRRKRPARPIDRRRPTSHPSEHLGNEPRETRFSAQKCR